MAKRFPTIEDFKMNPEEAVRGFRESVGELLALLVDAQKKVADGSEVHELLRDAADIALSLEEWDDFSFVKGIPDQKRGSDEEE